MKRKIFTMFIFSALFAGIINAAPQRVINFDAGDTTNFSKSDVGAFQVGTEAHTGTGYYECTLTAVPTNPWDRQFVPEAILGEDLTMYRVVLWAKKTSADTALYNFTAGDYDYNEVGRQQDIVLKSSWTKYTMVVSIEDADALPFPGKGSATVKNTWRTPIHPTSINKYQFDDYSVEKANVGDLQLVGDTLTVDFGWQLDNTVIADVTAFTVKVGGTAVAVTSATYVMNGTAPTKFMKLKLESTPAKDAVVTLSYSGALIYFGESHTVADMKTRAFTDEAVVNNNTGSDVGVINSNVASLGITSNIVNNELSFTSVVNNVKIYNVNGQMLKSSNNCQTVNVSDLSNGLYIAKVSNGNTFKFVKR